MSCADCRTDLRAKASPAEPRHALFFMDSCRKPCSPPAAAGAAADHPAADRGLRPVHGESRFDRDRDGPARHGPQPGGEPAHHERGHDLLSPEPRGLHPRQRLARRPLRRAGRLRFRHRPLHGQLDPLRPGPEPAGDDRRAGPSGHGRRHDDAGGPAGAAALGHQGPARPGDELCHHPRPGRSRHRPADRRLHRDIFLLALDLLHQSAHRPAGHRAGAAHRAQYPPARSRKGRHPWSRAHRPGAGGARFGSRQHRPRRLAHLGGRARGGSRRPVPDALRPPCAQGGAAGHRSQAAAAAHLSRLHRRRECLPHGHRRHALPSADDVPAGISG